MQEPLGEQYGTLECAVAVSSGAHRVGHPQRHGTDWTGADPWRSVDISQATSTSKSISGSREPRVFHFRDFWCFFLFFSPRSRVQPLNPPPPRPCPFQDDFRAFRRQLDDKRPLIEQSILTGRQLVANEAPLSDASDSEGNSSLDSSMCVCRILRKEEKKKNIFFCVRPDPSHSLLALLYLLPGCVTSWSMSYRIDSPLACCWLLSSCPAWNIVARNTRTTLAFFFEFFSPLGRRLRPLLPLVTVLTERREW